MEVKSILVSQPKPSSEASPYFALSKRQNVKIDFRSFIHVEGLTAKDVRAQKIDLSQFSAVVLTSRNAVDHFFRMAEEMRFSVPASMKYFCQSEAVAYYLQKYIVYRKRKVFIGGKTFRDLIPLFKKHTGLKLLLPSSDSLKPEIEKTLNDLKLDWKRAVMYHTVCSDLSDLSDVKYDILVFFSPSGIKSLFENFPEFKQENTRIAAFGKSTVKAAEEMNLKIDIQVPTKETPSMAMALEKYIKEHN